MADSRTSRPDLLIVAHGERGGAGTDALAHALAERMASSGRFAKVAVGFIRSAPPLEAAAAELCADRVVVYPLFMSDGYYVRTAIPQRLGIAGGHDALGRAVRVAPPLGLDPALPGLVADMAREAARGAGIAPAGAHLLLVAHGSSKSSHSADAARKVAGATAPLAGFAGVEVCFLEEEPLLDEALSTIAGPAVVLGLFAGHGMHAGEDLPQAIGRSRRRDLVAAGSLGADARLADLVEAALARFA